MTSQRPPKFLLVVSLVLPLSSGCGEVERSVGRLAPSATSSDGGAPPLSEPEAALSEPLPSSGCGKPLPARQVATVPGSRTGYTEWFVSQTGATLVADDPSKASERQFFVRVPDDYDPEQPYRVVYIPQECGAPHGGMSDTAQLFEEALGGTEQAVYVGLSVADVDTNPGCFDIDSGPSSLELEAFDLIHTLVESTYCVDNHRIFVAGFQHGGSIANLWGCYFGGTPSPPLDRTEVGLGLSERKFAPQWAIRGQARVSGWRAPGQPVPCNGPSAGLWIHDTADDAFSISSSIGTLTLMLSTNGCSGNYEAGPKRPWAPAENIAGLEGGVCQEYTGCPPDVARDYPLVFCTTSGQGSGDQEDRAIRAFTSFFAQMDPAR